MSFDFVEVIAVISILQLLFLFLFLVLHKKGRPASHRILAAFLLFNALSILEFLLYRFKDSIGPRYPDIFFVGSLFVALWSPSLYFYTKSLFADDFRLRRKDLLHGLPFLALVIYTMFDFHLRSAEYKRLLLAAEYQMGYGEKIIIFTALHVQILIYLVLSFLAVRRFRKESQSFYSSLERLRLSWLKFILIAFIAIWSVDIVYLALWRTRFAHLSYFLDIISFTLTIAFANVLVFKGLNAPEILSGPERAKPGQVNRRPNLSDAEKKQHLDTLISFMSTRKPYLQPDLTIVDLAAQSRMPSRLLSQVINECLSQNFFDFVNSYRVEEFKNLMLETGTREKTILQVLFDAGFNSKASFNRAFKKHTGMTPSQFKKNRAPSPDAT